MVVTAAIGFMLAAIAMAFVGSVLTEDKLRVLMGMLALFFLLMVLVPSIFLSHQSTHRRAAGMAVWSGAAGVCYQLLLEGGLHWLGTPLGWLAGAVLGLLVFYARHMRDRAMYGDRA